MISKTNKNEILWLGFFLLLLSPSLAGGYDEIAVPVGIYRLEVWHPEYGTKALTVNLVREREVQAVNLDLKKTR